MSESIDLNQTNIEPENYLELFGDLQGNILTSHGRNLSRHLFLKFRPGKEAEVKSWLVNFADNRITSAAEQEQQRLAFKKDPSSEALFVNLYLSSLAYSYLGFNNLSQLPDDQAFRQGMASRKAVLADPAQSEWEAGFSEDVDAMVLLAMDSELELEGYSEELQLELADIAEVTTVEKGQVIRNDKDQVIEHFGFVDGVSNPLYLKRKIDVAGGTDKFNPTAPLSLILAKDPLSADQWAYGSYVVYRKLQQDVQGWNDEVLSLADSMDIQPALAGAYAVGRFQDGTPVVNSEVAIDTPEIPNNFNYQDDKDGLKCPFHAHIRKTNPRGQTAELFPGTTVKSERDHRITRRAISFGPAPEQSAAKPSYGQPSQSSKDVGLLFICMQSSIVEQFEFMQASWANANQFIEQSVGQDTVIGQGIQSPTDGQAYPTTWGGSEQSRFDFNLFVNMKGGEYFFAPSLSFLKSL